MPNPDGTPTKEEIQAALATVNAADVPSRPAADHVDAARATLGGPWLSDTPRYQPSDRELAEFYRQRSEIPAARPEVVEAPVRASAPAPIIVMPEKTRRKEEKAGSAVGEKHLDNAEKARLYDEMLRRREVADRRETEAPVAIADPEVARRYEEGQNRVRTLETLDREGATPPSHWEQAVAKARSLFQSPKEESKSEWYDRMLKEAAEREGIDPSKVAPVAPASERPRLADDGPVVTGTKQITADRGFDRPDLKDIYGGLPQGLEGQYSKDVAEGVLPSGDSARQVDYRRPGSDVITIPTVELASPKRESADARASRLEREAADMRSSLDAQLGPSKKPMPAANRSLLDQNRRQALETLDRGGQSAPPTEMSRGNLLEQPGDRPAVSFEREQPPAPAKQPYVPPSMQGGWGLPINGVSSQQADSQAVPPPGAPSGQTTTQQETPEAPASNPDKDAADANNAAAANAPGSQEEMYRPSQARVVSGYNWARTGNSPEEEAERDRLSREEQLGVVRHGEDLVNYYRTEGQALAQKQVYDDAFAATRMQNAMQAQQFVKQRMDRWDSVQNEIQNMKPPTPPNPKELEMSTGAKIAAVIGAALMGPKGVELLIAHKKQMMDKQRQQFDYAMASFGAARQQKLQELAAAGNSIAMAYQRVGDVDEATNIAQAATNNKIANEVLEAGTKLKSQSARENAMQTANFLRGERMTLGDEARRRAYFQATIGGPAAEPKLNPSVFVGSDGRKYLARSEAQKEKIGETLLNNQRQIFALNQFRKAMKEVSTTDKFKRGLLGWNSPEMARAYTAYSGAFSAARAANGEGPIRANPEVLKMMHDQMQDPKTLMGDWEGQSDLLEAQINNHTDRVMQFYGALPMYEGLPTGASGRPQEDVSLTGQIPKTTPSGMPPGAKPRR